MKEAMWFGCANCGYTPERDRDRSSKNWQVFTPGKCPQCGSEMRINFFSFINNGAKEKGGMMNWVICILVSIWAVWVTIKLLRRKP